MSTQFCYFDYKCGLMDTQANIVRYTEADAMPNEDGSMPTKLKWEGVYFDPECVKNIASQVYVNQRGEGNSCINVSVADRGASEGIVVAFSDSNEDRPFFYVSLSKEQAKVLITAMSCALALRRAKGEK